MRRTWRVWLPFAMSLSVVLGVMGWISRTVSRLDRAETAARRRAELEENVRLALWRMDTALTPLLAQESARPYSAYAPRDAVPQGPARSSGASPRGAESSSLIPNTGSPYVLLHFQFLPDGQLVSPQVPAEWGLIRGSPQDAEPEVLTGAEHHFARVRRLLDRDQLIAHLPDRQQAMTAGILARQSASNPAQQAGPIASVALAPRDRGDTEFMRRGQAIVSNAAVMARQQATLPSDGLDFPAADVADVVMTPFWIDGELILARRLTVRNQEFVQGCLLDWPGIRVWLSGEITDLLPRADLKPAFATDASDGARMLAGLPVQLIVNAPAVAAKDKFTPLRLSLLVAWLCLLVAAAAAGMLLAGVLRLSERRAAFVSAVTHELRTPLTTFHMYTEMLADGMVSDPHQRQEYLVTLREEAVRLSHLIENVLAYARLERGRKVGAIEPIPVTQLFVACIDRLSGRAVQAGMELVLKMDPAVRGEFVQTNASAVEQILMNLVDNACKYAASAEDRRIELAVSRRSRYVEVRVRDHGPGVPAPIRRRLFRSFAKSAQEAACSAPGIGLGLALSRRLAKDMRSRLDLDWEVTGGACFVLALPLAQDDRRRAD